MAQEMLQLSGLQHFAFCPRQWALIHLEMQWHENQRTAEGRIFHTRAHDGPTHEFRDGVLILRDLRVFSNRLGISGSCDVVEMHRDPAGISLPSYEGTWQPYPVEYKRGKPKDIEADRLQLCAQALCLEEMLLCTIPEGALFYGDTHRREAVPIDDALRTQAETMLRQMHQYLRAGHTPKAKQTKSCNACSLQDVCLPRLSRLANVSSYINEQMEDAYEKAAEHPVHHQR